MNQTSKTNPQPLLKQLNFKIQEDFYWKLKNFSTIKRLKMGEVLVRAFKFYEQREAIVKELNNYRQNIQTIEQQMQTFQGKISWAELESRLNNFNPASFNKIGLVITYRILRGGLEECLRSWKKG